ncbi:MAG: hypothetical protein ACI4F8_05290 [Lachnospiraceae bacterium]
MKFSISITDMTEEEACRFTKYLTEQPVDPVISDAVPAQPAIPAVQPAIPVAQPVPQPAIPVAAATPAQPPVIPIAPVPVQIPQTQLPVNAPGPEAQPAVPTTAVPQQYTFDQLAVALSNLCVNMNKQGEVHSLLNQFGVNALFDLPKERYGEFATAMRAIGGVI